MTIHPFRLSPQTPTAVTWQGRLNGATTENEVVGIVRDFVTMFDPAELARLPVECRPRKFVDADDVTNYAFTVVQHCTGGDSESSALLEKLATFLSHASIRLARILSFGEASQDDSRQSA